MRMFVAKEVTLDFLRCRSVWVPDQERWSPPPPHVEEGVRQIVANPYFLLADDMGGMKTAQAIISAQFLHDAGLIDRVIVVAPAAVWPKVWFDLDLGQLAEQTFHDKLNVVSAFHAKIRQWRKGPEGAAPLKWIVTGYEFLRMKDKQGAFKNVLQLLPYCGPRTMLILDESSFVRTWDSAQTEAAMLLRWRHKMVKGRMRPVMGLERCGRVLELNGTPVAESPMDMFSQGNLLHPGILDCRYVSHYKARYAVQEPVLGSGGQQLTDPYGHGIQKIKPGAAGWTNLDDLTKRFAPYVLRRDAKSLGIDFALPPVGRDVVMDAFTWKVYNEMKRELVAWLKSGVATAATAGVKVIRLAQITSGFVGGVEDAGLDDLGLEQESAPLDGIEWIGREKLDYTLEWHAEQMKRLPDLKLLLWCRFVPELRRLLKEERAAFPGVPVGAACGQKALDGQQSQRVEREEALRLLHPKTAPEGPATVGATQGTGAIGLNFTACRTTMDVSYGFSNYKKRQGDARVNRPGQTGPVSSFYLVAVGPKGQRTIDHHVMLMRTGKAQVADYTVAAWTKALTED